ncbi:TetR/AcrR family transcriptional regulator [Microbacterium sp. APC 3901]|uniref:TetR/AcrR family transcriptional regulator n=1 Tax=Microbacterium sp. APC 3901 TaxID=3035192 RepID=UPI0025B417DF|nr:TetR/AcrR family transcriptional regulator [Microbacterium sp. APC 3901]MDN3445740.1 helix-turn-helix domain-containing protein [Microbacterium sp. APC 3901]
MTVNGSEPLDPEQVDARAASNSARRRRTERRIIDAATALFLRDGYASTSLAAVADAAGVSERTVYVRFAGKVALFQRVIEVGIVGDLDDVPLPEREWSIRALSAPSARERIVAFADGVADMHERLGPLMAVNGEVEGSEAVVHASAQAWRSATHVFLRRFWGAMCDDGLLSDACDLQWLVDTTTVLTAAESRLLITRTLGWDRTAFRDWMVKTMMILAEVRSTA